MKITTTITTDASGLWHLQQVLKGLFLVVVLICCGCRRFISLHKLSSRLLCQLLQGFPASCAAADALFEENVFRYSSQVQKNN